MLDNIVLAKVTIEITRRCNMSCPHCLRGDAQDTDIDFDVLDTFLLNLKGRYIRNLLITGGEPSLNTEAIKFILEKVREYSISVWTFMLVTNGHNISQSFVNLCNEWIDSCQLGGIVLVSRDKYHKKPSEIDESMLNKIKSITSVYRADYSVVDLGKAHDNNIGVRDRYVFSSDRWFSHYKNNLIFCTSLVLACTGDVLSTCDYSYGEEYKFKICRYDDQIIKILFEIANKSNIHSVNFTLDNFSIYNWIKYLEEINLI